MKRSIRRVLAFSFFVMSPFFPGNNWFEVTAIGTVTGLLEPWYGRWFSPDQMSIMVYGLYNLIAIAGYFALRDPEKAHRRVNWLELAGSLVLLFVAHQLPRPWNVVLLVLLSLFLMRRWIRDLVYRFVQRRSPAAPNRSGPKDVHTP